MSRRRSSIWLRGYPPAWRERYGEELEDLVLQSIGGGRVPWRVRVDLMRSGAAERVRGWGLTGEGAPPETQAKAGALLVLCAWVLFVVAGIAVQRFSEHWQGFTPASARALPSGAFQVLILFAALGGGLVAAGAVSTAPRLLAFMRDGGWRDLRGMALRAALATAVAIAAIVGLSLWARGLGVRQRNGHDLAYGFVFAAGGLLVVACLGTWTAVAVAAAQRLELSARVLKLEVGLAVAVTVAMLVMTVATVIWWGALASRAPGALYEHPGHVVAALDVQLLAATVLMAFATALAAFGATHALRALPRLSPGPR